MLRILKFFKRRYFSPIKYIGPFSTWKDALANSTGYNSTLVLDKVKGALLKIKNGEAVYERDSVLFKKIEYPWPILSALLWISTQNRNKLNIIDFGGSLGTTYFQNRLFLRGLDEVNWNIVEQEHFVNCGKKYFENNQLKFFYDIESCLRSTKPVAILLSSVLQYLKEPYSLLQQIVDHRFEYLLIDRTFFHKNNSPDQIMVQQVPEDIYKASYPCWFFNEKDLLHFIQKQYELITDFKGFQGGKGFIFKIQNS